MGGKAREDGRVDPIEKAQRDALEHFANHARARATDAQRGIAHILRMCNISPTQYEEAYHAVKSSARVALHFHPDRPTPEGVTVAEALEGQGVYRSQFETGLSSGSVSAFPGEERS